MNPKPDLIVLNREFETFDSNPQPQDIALLVEIADSTLNFDLTIKAALYARAGIAEYWVLDVVAKRLIVHRGSPIWQIHISRGLWPGRDHRAAGRAPREISPRLYVPLLTARNLIKEVWGRMVSCGRLVIGPDALSQRTCGPQT